MLGRAIERLSTRILSFSRFTKRTIALSSDVCLSIFTVAFAYYLRLDEWVFPVGTQWLSYGGALAFSLPLFIKFGLYRAIFRYAGKNALATILQACALYAITYALVFTFLGIPGVPRTVGIIQPILNVVGVCGSRLLVHFWLDGHLGKLFVVGKQRRALIYGAGAAGRQLASALTTSDEMRLVGFVDDDASLRGSTLNGHIIHGPENLATLIEALGVEELLLAIPTASRRRRAEILESIQGVPATLRTLPSLVDLAHGNVTINDLRTLDIDDLLGRDPVLPNHQLLAKNITGKVVAITGAGGSIGCELCRQVAQLAPKAILLIDQSEFNLYAIHQELEQKRASALQETGVRIEPILCSVRDEAQLGAAFATWKPDTIYHTAAYKHVPLVEQNPVEGIRNNVFGTLSVALLARRHGVRDFVLISTDKAVRPTSVMGASKRLAELILQALAAEGGATCFSMVRFGNVLGSSGSVVPLFRAQIKNGGPITVTDPEVTRYFMTIPEAASLVIQAGSMAVGGEVFVLDMGDPVKIIDLAHRMVELSGLTVKGPEHPDGDIEVKYVGLRSGEKLYEELLIGDNPSETGHPRIMKANEASLRWPELHAGLSGLAVMLDEGDSVALRARLDELIHCIRPSQDGMYDWNDETRSPQSLGDEGPVVTKFRRPKTVLGQP